MSHVMNRGADRQDIFSDRIDHDRYHTIVADAVDRGMIDVHAHVEMTNHFHLLVRSPRGELSDAMHRIQSEYARWYNERHGRTGPLFTGRFTSVPIESDGQLLTVARYIHRNPSAIVGSERLAEYPWSSYPVYLGRVETPEWLTTDVLFSSAGSSPAAIRRFVETDLPSDVLTPRARSRSVSFQELLVASSAALGVSASDLVTTRSGATSARQIVAMLAVELRVASTKELARELGLAGAGSLRVLARRGRVLANDDPRAASVRAAILDALGRSGCAVPGTGATGGGRVA
jgi:REP element-mobilizing transposase RayT